MKKLQNVYLYVRSIKLSAKLVHYSDYLKKYLIKKVTLTAFDTILLDNSSSTAVTILLFINKRCIVINNYQKLINNSHKQYIQESIKEKEFFKSISVHK